MMQGAREWDGTEVRNPGKRGKGWQVNRKQEGSGRTWDSQGAGKCERKEKCLKRGRGEAGVKGMKWEKLMPCPPLTTQEKNGKQWDHQMKEESWEKKVGEQECSNFVIIPPSPLLNVQVNSCRYIYRFPLKLLSIKLMPASAPRALI